MMDLERQLGAEVHTKLSSVQASFCAWLSGQGHVHDTSSGYPKGPGQVRWGCNCYNSAVCLLRILADR